MKNTKRFSKNYTIKKDSAKNNGKNLKKESLISIRQHLKKTSDSCLQEIMEFIRNANSCVISESE